MPTAIEFNHVSKQYRLGLVSTRTLSHDLQRWWTMNIRGKEDPYLKIGETNDRATKGTSDYVWALKDIDFKVEQGDVVGIIGKNGAGKSTLLKLLSKVTGPTTGTIKVRGRIGVLLEVGTGFHSEMTGRENIYLNGAILGMSRQEIAAKLDEIVDFSGCERYLDTPVKRYSSGMMVRLGFAVAAHLDPEILVVDEVLAVGDAEFQKKAIGKMQDVSKGEGRTVLFVSHNMGSIERLCDSGVYLENGCVKYIGRIKDTISRYLSDTCIADIPLAERKERKGNQSLKVIDCSLLLNGSKVNTIKTGDCFILRIILQKRSDIVRNKNVEVAANICDVLGQKLIQLSNMFIGQPFSIDRDIFSVDYVIDKLPLSEGTYHVRIYVSDNIDVLDWIDYAISFNVENGDYFGKGIIENSAAFITHFSCRING